MLLDCFTSARTGEVHESTARRYQVQEMGNSENKELEARVLAACYKVCFADQTSRCSILLLLAYRS